MAVRGNVRYKADYIWEAPDDDNRYEVIEGELYVSPAPSWAHQSALSMLFGYLWQHITPRGLGRIVFAPTGVVLDEHNGVEPDLLFISRERLDIISRRGVEGVPDLVVEALSPSTRRRDRGVKMRRYAASGVANYWILDLDARMLEPYHLGPDGYVLTSIYGPGSVFCPELFPGLEIPIDDLWV